MGAIEGKNEKAEQVQTRFESNIEKYTEEKKEIQDKAHEFEAELAHETQRANRFDLGEVFLEIALVITSITLLTGRKQYWMLGMVMAAAGIVTAASVLLLH